MSDEFLPDVATVDDAVPLARTDGRIVTETEVERALDFLRDSAKYLGEACARATKASNMIKHIEALEFKASDATSNDRRQADARTSESYVDAINEEAFAIGELRKMYALREAASMKIEVWRSQEATLRSVRI